jgi:hypothetical protein
MAEWREYEQARDIQFLAHTVASVAVGFTILGYIVLTVFMQV